MGLEMKVEKPATSENVFRENVRKEDNIRQRWVKNWQWLINRLREREEDILNYKKSSPKAIGLCPAEKPDERNLQPFPITTSMNYGWLAKRKEFKLEIFGSYYDNHKQAAASPDSSSSTNHSASE